MALPPVVNREDERRSAHRALEAVAAGAGAAGVLVTGEAGIGKSAVLSSILAEARGQGWYVLAAEADALERGIPYAALVRMFAALAAAGDLVATLGALGASTRGDARASFGLICGQTTQVLQALLDERPVALAFDDVDALDDDTLELLAIVVRRLSALRIALL